MKKIIICFVFLLCLLPNETSGQAYSGRDTLRANDSITYIYPPNLREYLTLGFKGTAGDSVWVYTNNILGDTTFWYQTGVTDLLAGTNVQKIEVNATPKKYLLNERNPQKVKVVRRYGGNVILEWYFK